MSRRLFLLAVFALALTSCDRDPVAPPLVAPKGPIAMLVARELLVTAVSAGFKHSCAVTRAADTIVCWGGDRMNDPSPPSDLGAVTQVSAGYLHTCAVRRADANVVCWGNNEFFQAVPPDDLGAVTQVSAGYMHSCAVTQAASSVVCWTGARKDDGQANPPSDLGAVTQLSAGHKHTCAVRRADATVVCWGNNEYGQAEPPSDLGAVTQVSAGGYHSCAVQQADGSVVCWGLYATPPDGLGPVTRVSAGGFHSCAVQLAEGAMVCWREGTIYDQMEPPSDLGAVEEVSAGWEHTCAVRRADEAVVCWGNNEYGQAEPPVTEHILPEADFIASGSLDAGSPIVLTLANARVPGFTGDASFTFAFDCGDGAEFGEFGPSDTVSCPTTAPGTRTVKGIVRDRDGDQSEYSASVTIHDVNTPPGTNVVVTPTDETTGAPSAVRLTFGSVSTGGTTTVTSAQLGQLQNGPPSPGSFRLGTPPTIYAIATAATILPGSEIEVCIEWSAGQFAPQQEQNLKLLHWDGSTWTDITDPLMAPNPNLSSRTICGTTQTLSWFLVAERNFDPVVSQVALLTSLASVGTAVEISASFSDQNAGDGHTAVIAWDDGTMSAGTIAEADGAGSAAASHTYSQAGVYTILVTVSDGMGTGTRSSAAGMPAYIVVYDASAGFVTGGGWIASPAGAYLPNPGLAGKATFGFVSKYQRGTAMPSGNTEFQFKAGNLTFSSTSFEWLVVAGARAQYKGVGMINGRGDYGFLLSAIDGQLSGGGGVDRFRLKIWDRSTGLTVYDNQLDAAEDATPTTNIGGGSIVIHG